MDWRFALSLPLPFGIVLLAALAGEASAVADEPLPVRIDRVVESDQPGPSAALVSDEEFARRIYLDLVGAVPTATELRRFLADTSPNRRALLIERLLDSPQYVRHMATTFDVMLMERRQEKHVKQAEWQKYLFDSFAQNKPWNQLVREVLNADGTDEKVRPAAKFYLDREAEPNLLTRDVGRMFFGMDLGCCQCHDHPLVSSYAQFDYYGIYAFVSRSTLFTDKDKKVFLAEKAEGDVKFTSVFTKAADEMRPCLPGEFEIDEPLFLKGEEYSVAPADNVRSVPKFSRRAKLAELATRGTNRAFNRNIVNRLWAMMMGRGLVEPLDMHHIDNPPSHPELLELLADEFVKMNFDIKAFLRALAWTNTYQRSARSPIDVDSAEPDTRFQIAGLEARSQQTAQSLTAATEAGTKARAEYDAARKSVTAGLTDFAKANEAIAAAQKAAQAAEKALTEAQQQLAAKKDIAATLEAASKSSAEASAKLPQEKELAQAAEKFRTRATQLSGEVTTAEKLVADRTPSANSTAAAVTAAKSAANQIAEKVAEANKKLGELQQPLVGLAEKQRIEQVAALGSRSRLDATKAVQEIAALRATTNAARNKVVELDAQATNTRQSASTLAAQLPQYDTAIATAKSSHDESAKRLMAAQMQLSERQQAVALLNEAIAKAELAAQKLPQDTELKQAADALKTRRDQLTAESTSIQTAVATAEQAAKTANDQLVAAQKVAADARAQIEAMQQALTQLDAQLAEAKIKRDADDVALRVAVEAIKQTWAKRFAVAPLEPLTPEQIGWSILKVTGVVDQYRIAAEVEINKSLPLDPNAPADAARIAEREKQIEQSVFDKLQGNVATFVALFGHGRGQPQRDFFATVDQALFFANGGVLQSWLNPGGDNLVARTVKLMEPAAVADELYVSILSRRPTDEEALAIAKYLETRTTDRPVAIQEIAWALITSIEFRFQ